ncbi:MAG: hypothetical protein JRN09_08930 [Nitrososphaerota archaeon]|jgi:hypothetical protein|nr:hypothetical protein [Nitrososphaerota archaeon]
MRWLALVPAIISLSFLSYCLAAAPFAFVFLGARVYQWPDGRVTLLGCLAVCSVLLAGRALLRPRAQTALALACMAVCGFNFLLFVVFNYGTNLPDGLLPQAFSAGSAMKVLQWTYGERLSPIYGLAIQTGAWFSGTVASVFALRLRRGVGAALLDAASFASFVLMLYALGVYLIIPQWSARAVTGLQAGTPVSWFTNDDLLLCSGVVFVTLFALRRRFFRQAQ